jgi:hypothetical protein
METKIICKGNTLAILVLKIVLCFMFLINVADEFTATAQSVKQDSLKYWQLNTTDDPFWDPHCPTPSSIFDGYNLWVFRQKMAVRAYQTLLNNVVNLNNGKTNKIQLTNYMPLIDAGNFNSIVGTQYSKFDIQPEHEFDFNKSIQMVWLWTAWQYKYARWNFNLTTENSFRGDENTLYSKTGNRNLFLVYLGYELNNGWDLILLARFGKQQMVGQSKDISIVGVQARYQPSNKLKIVFGAPTVFAAEWTPLSKTDIGMKFMYTTESQFFIRQRLNKSVSISAQYYSSFNNSDATYFNNSIFSLNNSKLVTYNNISYLQHQLFASLDLKVYKDIGFSIGAGYIPGSEMNLYNNSDKVYSGIKSKDSFFVNFGLQFIRLK